MRGICFKYCSINAFLITFIIEKLLGLVKCHFFVKQIKNMMLILKSSNDYKCAEEYIFTQTGKKILSLSGGG